MKINLKKVLENKSKEFQELLKECETLFADYFKKQYLETLEELNKNPFIQKTSDDFFSKLSKFFVKVLKQAQKEANNDFNRNSFKYGYKTDDFFIDNKEALAWAEARAGYLISQVDETTQKEVNYIISKALKSGKTLKEIASEIKAKFDSFSDYRAKLIAHMEVSSAYSYSEAQIFQKKADKLNTKGYKRAKTQDDDNVRPSHKANELAGWIRADKAYPGTGTMWAPHGFACRCSDIYSLVNPKTGLIEDSVEYNLEQKEKFDKYIKSDIFPITQKEKFAMIAYGLEKREVYSIKYWSGEGYKKLENGFYKNYTDETYQASIPFFIGALSKIPGEEKIVYRGHKILNKQDLDIINNLKIGDTYTAKTFFATSLSIKTAKNFVDKNKIILKIKSKNAKNIGLFSINKAEKEYLLMPNIIYKIIKIEKKDGFLLISLEEI